MNRRLKRICFACVAAALLPPLIPAARAAGMSAQTRSEVIFAAGTGPAEPLDPDYPDTDLSHPDDVNVTNDGDSLSLNAVPDFVFARADGSDFPASMTGEKRYALYGPQRPYAQVSDLRGTGGGWKLSVSASRFLRNGAPALAGAEIRLLGGAALSSNPALSPPEVNSCVVIECNGQAAPVTVAEARENHSWMGAWIIRWYPLDAQGRFTALEPDHEAGVELYVPPGAPAFPGSCYVTLYWTLSNSV